MTTASFLKTLWVAWQLFSGLCVGAYLSDRWSRKGSSDLLKQAKRERIECEDLLKRCEETLATNKKLKEERKWVS